MSEQNEYPPGLIVLAPREGWYIDPVLLLQYLENRVKVYADKIATPGLDPIKTELLRGCRLNSLNILTELTKVLKDAT